MSLPPPVEMADDRAMLTPPIDRWPAIARRPEATAWLNMQADLGLAPRTLDAYGRGLESLRALGFDLIMAPSLSVWFDDCRLLVTWNVVVVGRDRGAGEGVDNWEEAETQAGRRSVQAGWVGRDRKEITEPSPPAGGRPVAAAFVMGTRARGRILFEDLVAEFDALIADVDARAGDELADLRLVLPAEGTARVPAAVLALVHDASIRPAGRTSWSGVRSNA